MKKIILASSNIGKIKELSMLLAGHFEIIPQLKKNVSEVKETGLSFVENALIKARNASKQTHLPALADDSGIVVDILNGAPGIYSARYAGAKASDAANRKKLLNTMKNVLKSKRQACFWCAMVFVKYAKDATPIIVQKSWEGSILFRERGDNGFGYDSIFYVPTHFCSSAELEIEEKNRISHRAQALKALIDKLTKITF